MADFELNAPGSTRNPWTPVGVKTADDPSITATTIGAGVIDFPEKSGIWVCVGGQFIEAPNFPEVLTGDTIEIKVATGESPTFSIYRDGVEVPQNWRGYPRWWLQRLRVWWLTRTDRLTGSDE